MDEDSGQLELLYIFQKQPHQKIVCQLLLQLSILTILPSNLMSISIAREMKTYIYTKTCTQMFIAVLFVIIQKYKQPNILQWVDGQTIIYPQDRILLSSKKNSPLVYGTQMNLKCLLPGEIKQSQKITYCIFPFA